MRYKKHDLNQPRDERGRFDLKATDPLNRIVTIRISEQQYHDLAVAAESRDQTKRDFVVDAVILMIGVNSILDVADTGTEAGPGAAIEAGPGAAEGVFN